MAASGAGRGAGGLARRIGGRVRRGLASRLLAPWRRLARSTQGGSAPRILLIAWFDPWGLGTIRDHVAALASLSCFRVDVLNLFFCRTASGRFELPASIRLADYQGVIIHPTVSYSPDNLNGLDARRDEKLADFAGVKVLLKQDEHYRTERVLAHLERTGYQVLATCLEPGEAQKVYPPGRLPGLELLYVLTGYVTDDMLALRLPPLAERPIDVGYRGSLQPWFFGRLAFEKQEIGDRFLIEGARLGLRMDISSRWEDRYFGAAWYGFLGRCKATLGVESGASIVDFDGDAEHLTAEYLAAHPGASFDALESAVLLPFNHNVRYRAISPRHLEAAACRTVQILYEGRYQGIFRPWEHYLPLRRDFGNLDEVVRALRDPRVVEPMVERAFVEVVADPANRYPAFVAAVDGAIDRALARR
jgi:hypothetical protein